MSVCTTIVGLIVLVALVFVSPPALAIVVVGGLAAWFLRSPDAEVGKNGDEAGTATATATTTAARRRRTAGDDDDDDTLSVDSGIWSAQDFAMQGAIKDELVRPHSQPPAPPAAEVSAFRSVKASEGVDRNDSLYENHLDADHFGQRMSRGHEGNLRHLYTNGLNRAIKVARSELPMKDPNLIPIDPAEPVGCPRPLGKL